MKRILLVPALTSLLLCACNKQEIDLGAPQDASKAEFFYNDIHNMTDEACSSGDLSRSSDDIMSGCATVTLDTISMPHTCTIDFGTSNCLCNDGKYRRGIIQVSFNGRYRTAGTTITITTNNYFINDNQVTGTHTVVNQGTNGQGNIYYSVNVTGSVILANNGGTITWTSSRVREWTEGSGTADLSDDVYSITGNGEGTSAAGTHISVIITQPLVRKLSVSCRQHFVSGTVEIEPDGKPVRTLDYGNGDCDDIATVTINGSTYTIHLW